MKQMSHIMRASFQMSSEVLVKKSNLNLAVCCLMTFVFLAQAAGDGINRTTPTTTAHPDLICFVCEAARMDCPVIHYKFPVAHLETGCYGCYKEWKEGVAHATRKCLEKANMTEFRQKTGNSSVSWSGCSSKTDPVTGKPIYFCLCTDDYCNSASTHQMAIAVPIAAIIAVCYLSWPFLNG
ncbi:uncharacterized protein LOC135488893 [Lineus longissimus]|uniref:uncharacterized protein LOC135488893 n=1 Tax=Lineus longissimus TaxID=88925 RepID=UPI002B4FB59D